MSNRVPVTVQQGIILGEEDKLPNGLPFYSFKGIPYAVPPVGHLRFQAPQTLERFSTAELDCTNERDVAFHRDPFTSDLVGSEDSLFLNVYTPKLKSDKPLPVMVWVHGGAFLMGSGNSDFFYPLYLMQEDVIVVTLNYRLGMFGFLSLPEGNIPGNAGLKDQLLALKWVNENIQQFNGDNTNITFFGQSAGAAAIHLHVLSENSRKYFHKAIVQSGTANMEWVMQKDPEYKARRLAELLGFSGTDKEVVDFLEKIREPANILKYLLNVLTPDERRRGLPMSFKPVVEAKSEDAIVTRSPLESLKIPNHVNIPIMMGYTSTEGITMLANAVKKLEQFQEDLARMIPRSVNLNPDDENCLKVADQIRKFYFNNGKIDKKSISHLGDLMTDYHFNIGINIAAELHARNQYNSPLYFYRFNYDGGLNMFKKWFNLQKLKGACHGDELFYLFQMALIGEPLEPGSQDEKMVKTMCKMWANFAKYSNPTPENDSSLEFNWKPVKNICENEKFILDYLEIDENIRMEQNPDKERIDFWRDIYKTWNKDFLKPKL